MAERCENIFMISLLDLSSFLNISSQALHKYIKKHKVADPILVNKRAYIFPEEARKLLLHRGYRYSSRVISFQMLKGGCSKTTSALNIGIRSNMYGARVLLIDLDQQANLSFAFDIENPDLPVWVDLVEDDLCVKDLIVKINPTLHIVPSNLNNSTLDKVLLNGKRNIASSISQYLKDVREEYDLIIIDTAPNLSAINTAAACCSDLVVLPIMPDKFSYSGLQKTLDDLENIKSEFGCSFKNKILFTRFDGRETASHELLKLCFSDHGDEMLKSFIRVSSDFKNSIKSGRTIFSKRSSSKEDYDLVTREIMELDSSLEA